MLTSAVAALRASQAIGVPTDTVYGLAALEIDVLFALKERPRDLDVPVLASDTDQAWTIGVPTPAARDLAERYWPGPLTIVVPRRDEEGSVGLRVPDHDVPRALCREVGPLPCTSANRHGEPPLTTAAAVRATFPSIVVIDGGECKGDPSTVVDCTSDPPRVLRVGALRDVDSAAG